VIEGHTNCDYRWPQSTVRGQVTYLLTVAAMVLGVLVFGETSP
jgi:hypothetical protein